MKDRNHNLSKDRNMTESKLMLHCGGQVATREQVAEVVTPEATDTWQPVPHIRLVNEI